MNIRAFTNLLELRIDTYPGEVDTFLALVFLVFEFFGDPAHLGGEVSAISIRVRGEPPEFWTAPPVRHKKSSIRFGQRVIKAVRI